MSLLKGRNLFPCCKKVTLEVWEIQFTFCISLGKQNQNTEHMYWEAEAMSSLGLLDKGPQNGCLTEREIYCLTDPEIQNLKWECPRGQAPSKILGRTFPCFLLASYLDPATPATLASMVLRLFLLQGIWTLCSLGQEHSSPILLCLLLLFFMWYQERNLHKLGTG